MRMRRGRRRTVLDWREVTAAGWRLAQWLSDSNADADADSDCDFDFDSDFDLGLRLSQRSAPSSQYQTTPCPTPPLRFPSFRYETALQFLFTFCVRYESFFLLRSSFVYCATGGFSSFSLCPLPLPCFPASRLLPFYSALERENLIFLFISYAPRRLQTQAEVFVVGASGVQDAIGRFKSSKKGSSSQ